MTTPPRDRVKELFQRALDLPREERDAFLDAECASDAALRRRVRGLLVALDGAGSFLASPTQTSTVDAPCGASGPRLTPGSTLGSRYRIVGLAGTGGMGEVYRAEDLELSQTVALKLLPEDVERDELRLDRLRHEVRIARQVSHPNVCRVYDLGEADGRRFLTMEWIEGHDLASILSDGGRIASERASFIARQVCAGLASAHDRGVVHRDLKPANVMVDDRGVARITDFGLAELGAVAGGDRAREGTPRYMSPEQLRGDDVGRASDLYALGLLLYELFTGTPAHAESSVAPPEPPSRLSPDIDPRTERAILRCLETDPVRRPTSARDVADALPGGGSPSEAHAAAQRRADGIAAFREELAEVRRAGLLRLDDRDLRAVEAHHDRVLLDLVRGFDVDLGDRGKQLSLGMRVVSLLGAIALAASVYYFFYRVWGTISTPLQIGILALAPASALGLTAVIARRERRGYFTAIAALLAFACLIVDTSLLSATFNLVPTPLSLLIWGSFALILAYGYRLRLLLVVGLVLSSVFFAAAILNGTGGYWPGFFFRPEGLLPGGIVALAVAASREGRDDAFGPVYRTLGVGLLVGPMLVLGMAGSTSYLPLSERTIEIMYQLLGFALSAGAIGFGIARRSREVVYTGTLLFVTLLFLEFAKWWWAWMPRYLFFLIVALASVGVLVGLRHLRATLAARLVEAGS